MFAYGQTGCGKSHTMQGPDDTTLLSQRGIISRSFEHIFDAIAVSTGARFLALVSYLEIYNEQIRDLLCPDEAHSNLSLKEIPGEGVVVQNLSTHAVHTSEECEKLLIEGNRNRAVGVTLMNAGSSRSHSIFTISLEQITVTGLNDTEEPTIKKGKLNLVDLAGSERQSKTGAAGERLKEATKINLSLSALGNVISALVDGKTKHIPYRDSKLTRLLQDSLGGNTKTLMIGCIAPSEFNYDETLSTLRYASRAKNIHNKPRVNEDPKDTMLREYQDEILKLKKQLESTNINSSSVDSSNLEKVLEERYEAEVLRLKAEHENHQKEKELLHKSIEQIKKEYEAKLNAIASNQPVQPITSERVVERLEMIKNALIGGEKSNDIQLREKHAKKKRESEKRLSALAHALSRIEGSEDRDMLQEHYSSITHELQTKSDTLRKQRHKIRALDQEIIDLQSEFQLDRADYLETIRRLEMNLKFYQQIWERASPILRRDNRFWDLDRIQNESQWNDDLKKWKINEELLVRVRLPPAVDCTKTERRGSCSSLTAPGRLESLDENQNSITEPNLNEPDTLMKVSDF